MGKTVIAIVALVIGGIGGALLGGSLIGGAMTGAGAATGLSAGICTTVKAAQDEGVMTPEQVDQVLNRAARDLAAIDGVGPTEDIAGSAAACDAALARLRDSASS